MIATRFLNSNEFILYGTWVRQQSPETLADYFGIQVSNTYIDQLIDLIGTNTEEHYFLVATRGKEWVGVIHMARMSEHEIEFGIMVAPQHRHQGIADQLMSEAIVWIQNRGYKTLYLHCLNRNHVMQHLAAKHGLALVHDHGDVESHTRIPPASLISYAREIATANKNVFFMSLQNSWHPFNQLMG